MADPPRKLRKPHNLPGHAHELTFSCHGRLPLLSRDRTRRWFLDSLDQARQRWGFEVWAFVIMPEHVHVLIFPAGDGYDMASILQSIKQPMARKATNWLRQHSPDWLERLKVTWPNGRVEYRFWEQGGGYDRNIVEPKVAWASVMYLHNNPVRRGLVACATDWPWSSARCYAGWNDVEFAVDGKPPDPV